MMLISEKHLPLAPFPRGTKVTLVQGDGVLHLEQVIKPAVYHVGRVEFEIFENDSDSRYQYEICRISGSDLSHKKQSKSLPLYESNVKSSVISRIEEFRLNPWAVFMSKDNSVHFVEGCATERRAMNLQSKLELEQKIRIDEHLEELGED